MRTAINTYAAAWALGNIYLIFLHESIYHPGTLLLRISSSHSGGTPFPLRTDSIILNAKDGSKPW